MKKIIISVDNYSISGRRYVSGSDLVCAHISGDIKDAQMFESKEAAQEFMKGYSLPEEAIVTYHEVTCLDLKNKEDK